jgi:hypothetical protein
MQSRHDGEFDPLVAPPLPIVLVAGAEFELHREGSWTANRNIARG